MDSKGSLYVVGTGIQLFGQTTLESESILRSADKVLYVVADPVTSEWLRELNPSAEDLYPFYEEGKLRIDTYTEMVERILHFVEAGQIVCAAFYGHPGVFVYPSHEAIRRAREAGFLAIMLPGVSAEDCLFADLGIDPGRSGCQSFEATDFLIYRRKFDENVTLVLWQISATGQITHELQNSVAGMQILIERLSAAYGKEHEAIVYEAARYPICPPTIVRTRIQDLAAAPITGISTLVVPPLTPLKSTFADYNMVKRLGIPDSYIERRALRKV